MKACNVAGCSTGDWLRACYGCSCVICLSHSRVIKTLVWSSNGATSFTSRRSVRMCPGCAERAEADEGDALAAREGG